MNTIEMITFLVIFICIVITSAWKTNKIENKDNL